jgi:hypothetical protein
MFSREVMKMNVNNEIEKILKKHENKFWETIIKFVDIEKQLNEHGLTSNIEIITDYFLDVIEEKEFAFYNYYINNK